MYYLQFKKSWSTEERRLINTRSLKEGGIYENDKEKTWVENSDILGNLNVSVNAVYEPTSCCGSLFLYRFNGINYPAT